MNEDVLISLNVILALPRNVTKNINGEIVQETVDLNLIRGLHNWHIKGEWIDNNHGNHDPRDTWINCNCCGYATTTRFKNEYKFCPNCGADMRGENNGTS